MGKNLKGMWLLTSKEQDDVPRTGTNAYETRLQQMLVFCCHEEQDLQTDLSEGMEWPDAILWLRAGYLEWLFSSVVLVGIILLLLLCHF